jgi:hypothetical protein
MMPGQAAPAVTPILRVRNSQWQENEKFKQFFIAA